MDTIVYMIAVPMFVISLVGFIYAKLALRPKDPELDNWYCEFEDSHPEVVRYDKWTRITFAGVIISVLLVFAATFI